MLTRRAQRTLSLQPQTRLQLWRSMGTTQDPLTPEEAGRRAQAMAQKQSVTMATKLAHAGIDSSNPNAAMAVALETATTFRRRADAYAPEDYAYTRMGNPTRNALEHAMCQLEVPEEQHAVSCAFASGMMAASSVVLAHQAPLQVLMPLDLYHGVSTVLLDVFSRFQVQAKFVDLADETQLTQALREIPQTNDVIVWMETPSNPRCQVLDIQGIANRARATHANATILVDSTLAPPVLSQPLTLGADLVLHSATKYLAGHSDALIGVVTASSITDRGVFLGERLRAVQIAVGGVASAFDCWLTLRGLRTLEVRVERQSATALRIAQFLHAHPDVTTVHYPGLTDHPSHDIARRQMKAFGGVLSMEVKDDVSALALAGALTTIQRATSLGGTETLIEHRASIEPEGRVVSPPGLLRISVGLEDPDDLVTDLSRALDIMKKVCDESE